MAKKPQATDDPILNQSLSVPLLVSTLVLMLTLVWALYDELYAMRPWKDYQARFVQEYTEFLQALKPRQAEREQQVLESPEYQEMQAELERIEQANAGQLSELNRTLSYGVTPRMTDVRAAFQTLKSEIDAYRYQIETTESESGKASIQREIDEVRAREVEIEVPLEDGSGETETLLMTYGQLGAEFERLRARRADLQAERVKLLEPSSRIRARMTEYRDQRLFGLTPVQVDGLIAGMQEFDIEIKQIHVADVDLVDRCESCHLGIREPVTISKTDLGTPVFQSHPQPDLFDIHDPDRFGCTTCHQGNGRATSSVEKAHGRYKHWLWPLYEPENTTAGCHHCHAKEIVTEGAGKLNRGRELFQQKGCWGCHRFEGFDRESEQLSEVQQEIKILRDRQKRNEKEQRLSIQLGDQAPDAETAQEYYAREEELRLRNAEIDARLATLEQERDNLAGEVKKFGPNLKEIKVKLRKEWLPVWIANPQEFRPETKMPEFRLLDQEVRAISAYLWQNAIEGDLREHPPGDVDRGKELFETRGCLGCHSIGTGENRQGGDFAANLSRVGEKTNYDFLVRWIHDPHELTPDPNAGPDEVRLTPIMPNLRLSWQESRDIASYLMTQKTDATYPPADYLDDPELAEAGLEAIRHYGCAGCHVIEGLENESRIGTELTSEGSKPIERLDFALFTHEAETEGWYDHKGFFEHKLRDPAFFDRGKIKDHRDKLKMPNFHLSEGEIDALVTFLLGAVDSSLPESYHHTPEDDRASVQRGWWLIKRFNCQGCHQILPGDVTSFMEMERYQDPDWVEQMPPQLFTQGDRVQPEWLIEFLENPSLSETNPHENGVREYLHAHMPNFGFTDRQIKLLTQFFMARSHQSMTYLPGEMAPLTGREQLLARRLFTSRGAPCLKCHATGDPVQDRTATAPNFLLAAERLKPDWTARWMIDPQKIAPGTAMPSDLFRREEGRWVFDGPLPPIFNNYDGDHVDLLVRYMFQFTPAELQRLRAAGAGVQ